MCCLYHHWKDLPVAFAVFSSAVAAAASSSSSHACSPRVAGAVSAPSAAALTHRKIVQYMTYADNVDDVSSGHGTHVAGSLAGNIGSNAGSAAPDLYMFNGMAYNAKLAFFDGGNAATGTLGFPVDIGTYILGSAYTAGARIHSDSWGSAAIDSSYTDEAKRFDR
jgi:hypothetical protein